MKPLIKEQAIVLTGFTGKTLAHFSDFHEDVEARLGRPVFTHEFGDSVFADEIRELYKQDALKMIAPLFEEGV